MLIIDEMFNPVKHIESDLNNIQDSCSFSEIFSKKFFSSFGSFNDVIVNGSAFGHSEVPINEVR